jgi:hypothetical protein
VNPSLHVKAAKAKEREFFDAFQQTTRCSHCSWRYRGTAGEGRLEAQAHRRESHPELPTVTPKIRGRRKPGRVRDWSGGWDK